jgi:hypothetical protein
MKRFFGFLVVMLMIVSMFQMKIIYAQMMPKEILSTADLARGAVGGLEWELIIESFEDGQKESQTLNIKQRDFNVLGEFVAPPKVRGRKILMIDRNLWFIKPGLKKPVPISPRQKLLGKASNGDIASTNYAVDYEPIQVAEDKVEGELCYFFDLKATNKKATYDHIKYWISKNRLVGVKAEFYTVSGKMFKSATFEYENNMLIEGKSRKLISKMIIRDAIIKENTTVMIYNNVKVKKIPDSTFNLNLLMR